MALEPENISWKIYRAFGQILIIFSIGTFGFNYLLDDMTLLESLYLTVITLTTVGYGDISPYANASPGEKTGAIVFAIFLMIFGMSAFVYAAGILTQYITSGQLKRHSRMKKMQKKINKFRDHFLIIGASETGCYVANELKALERKFVLIDTSQVALEDYAGTDKSVFYIRGDGMEEKILLLAGLAHAKRVAITLRNPKDTLFLIITLKELAARNDWDFEIIAKCSNVIFERKFQLAGVDHIIKADISCADQVVTELFRPATKTFIDRLNNDSSKVIRIDEVTVSENSRICNQRLSNSKITESTGLRVCAIKEFSNSEWHINPHGEYIISRGDILIFIGDLQSSKKLRSIAENA